MQACCLFGFGFRVFLQVLLGELVWEGREESSEPFCRAHTFWQVGFCFGLSRALAFLGESRAGSRSHGHGKGEAQRAAQRRLYGDGIIEGGGAGVSARSRMGRAPQQMMPPARRSKAFGLGLALGVKASQRAWHFRRRGTKVAARGTEVAAKATEWRAHSSSPESSPPQVDRRAH